MKTCPVCHARCFDDMETCYGCLHRFNEGPAACGPMGSASGATVGLFGGEEAAASSRLDASGCASNSMPSRTVDAVMSDIASRDVVSGDDAERVTATVQPSKGLHGTMVVKIEIPASMVRMSALGSVPEVVRR